ncbi:MAG: TIGR02757 family protein [Marinilabiliales bacterium]
MSVFDIKQWLDEKVIQYNRPEFIKNDPIQIPHNYKRKEDIEISGFLTAIISWGQRKTIINNALKLMHLMDDMPYDFVMYSSDYELKKLKNFVHRTFQGVDCVFFIKSLKNIYLEFGSIENVFAIEIKKGNSVKNAIERFRDVFFSLPHEKRTEKHLPNISKGAAAKRINMFLRWMVRKDNAGVDFGIWETISPSMLYLPLDVHSANVSRQIGLLNRTQNDWKAVEEVTAVLKKMDPEDPVKYDFALFGAGVENDFSYGN